MAHPARTARLEEGEYLALEDDSLERHEYVRGEIFAMSGASSNHNDVATNVHRILREHVRGGPCRAYAIDVKLRVETASAHFYPDAFVTCDPRDREDSLVKRHAVLVVEILSDSTADYDRDDKFADYRKLESLREYVLIDSRVQRAEVFRRGEDAGWTFEPVARGGTLHLESVQLTVQLSAIYDDTDVPAERTRPSPTED